jgi:cardiolipin synthase
MDDSVSIIGTANFDARSFRLHFEISVITIDEEFGRQTELMLERDLANSKMITRADTANRSLAHRVGNRITRLFSPVL